MQRIKRNKERGSTLLEYAIAMPLFIMLLVISMDILRVLYFQLSLQYGVSSGVRQCFMSPVDKCPNQTAAKDLINNQLSFTGVRLEDTDTVLSCSRTNYEKNQCSTYDAGSARDMMVYRVSKNVTLYTLAGLPSKMKMIGSSLTLNVTVIGQNEP